jgi:cell wall-associated NlpC family hydrolase
MAARVLAAIDRMNARVERLVEDYNEVREALARTRVEQARTREQVLEARRRLRVAGRQLGKRLWTIYTGGAPSTLGQLLGADSVHDALVTTKYQEQVVGADRAAVDRVERLRRLAAARNSMSWASSGGAVAFARAQLGKPYLWGASGPSSYDCSGLTMAAYRSAGVWLPRVSRAQWGAGPHVGLGSLAPGDLVFFAHNPGNPGTIHHVGMYIGGGAMIEAPYSGARVRVASIGRRDYIGAVRPTG